MILEGFPKVAHVDDVRQCLDQNGFDEVVNLEKSKKSTHIVWTFNAKRDDREEIIQSCVVDEEGVSYDVVMPRAVKTRRVQSKSTPLRNPKTLGRTAAGSGPQALLQMTRNRKLKCGITKRMKQFWSGMARGTLRLSNSTPRTQPQATRLQSQLFPMKTFQKMEQRWNFDASSRTRRLFNSCTVQGLAEKEPGEKTLSQTTSCSR